MNEIKKKFYHSKNVSFLRLVIFMPTYEILEFFNYLKIQALQYLILGLIYEVANKNNESAFYFNLILIFSLS